MSRGVAERRRARGRGLWAERLCRLSLRLRGWQVLAQGWRPRRGSGAGEIDIIARRGGVIAFIEVKARGDAGSALAAVTPRQQGRIARAAAAFLAQRPELARLRVRFDVMVVRPWRPPHHLFDAWRPEEGMAKVGADRG